MSRKTFYRSPDEDFDDPDDDLPCLAAKPIQPEPGAGDNQCRCGAPVRSFGSKCEDCWVAGRSRARGDSLASQGQEVNDSEVAEPKKVSQGGGRHNRKRAKRGALVAAKVKPLTLARAVSRGG